MPGWSTLLALAGAAMLLFILPGPAVLYVVTRSPSRGRMAGLVSTTGIHVGSIVRVIAAAAGLSAITAASSVGFSAVRWLGPAYLIYLGIRTLLPRDDALAAGTLGDRLSKKPRRRTASRYGAGAAYLALGATAVVSGTGKR